MNTPGDEFLLQLAAALQQAEHLHVAEHLTAGLLSMIYPEWWEKVWLQRSAGKSKKEVRHDG